MRVLQICFKVEGYRFNVRTLKALKVIELATLNLNTCSCFQRHSFAFCPCGCPRGLVARFCWRERWSGGGTPRRASADLSIFNRTCAVYSHLAMGNPRPRHPATAPFGALRVMRCLSRWWMCSASRADYT